MRERLKNNIILLPNEAPRTESNENPSGLGIFNYNPRFPGQYADEETGTSYNYFRDCYDPQTGRYCQSDPIGLKGGINTFAYVDGNSLNRIDPRGLQYDIPEQHPKYPPFFPGPSHPKPKSCGCDKPSFHGTLGSGGIWGANVGPGSADSGIAVDSEGNMCIYSMLCNRMGIWVAAGLNFVITGGSGRLCSGSHDCGGVFRMGGRGVFGDVDTLYCGGGSLVLGRVVPGVGEGWGGGILTCRITLMCFNDSPCCTQH